MRDRAKSTAFFAAPLAPSPIRLSEGTPARAVGYQTGVGTSGAGLQRLISQPCGQPPDQAGT